jgi:hypothetical protein
MVNRGTPRAYEKALLQIRLAMGWGPAAIAAEPNERSLPSAARWRAMAGWPKRTALSVAYFAVMVRVIVVLTVVEPDFPVTVSV